MSWGGVGREGCGVWYLIPGQRGELEFVLLIVQCSDTDQLKFLIYCWVMLKEILRRGHQYRHSTQMVKIKYWCTKQYAKEFEPRKNLKVTQENEQGNLLSAYPCFIWFYWTQVQKCFRMMVNLQLTNSWSWRSQLTQP